MKYKYITTIFYCCHYHYYYWKDIFIYHYVPHSTSPLVTVLLRWWASYLTAIHNYCNRLGCVIHRHPNGGHGVLWTSPRRLTCPTDRGQRKLYPVKAVLHRRKYLRLVRPRRKKKDTDKNKTPPFSNQTVPSIGSDELDWPRGERQISREWRPFFRQNS